MVERWQKKKNLGVNLVKTALVPFTRRRSLNGLIAATLYDDYTD